MKKLFTVLFVLALVNTGFAQEPGTMDSSFGTDGTIRFSPSGAHNFLESVLVQEDGKILTIGRARYDGTNYATYVSRHNADGTLDETYAEGGSGLYKVNPAAYINGARDAVLADNGLLYIAGHTYDFENNTAFVLCLDENGIEYDLFGEGGYAESAKGRGIVYEAISIDKQGRPVVVGYLGDTLLVRRFTVEGKLDQNFGDQGTAHVSVGESINSNGYAVAITEKNEIIIAGTQWVVWYESEDEKYLIQKALVTKMKANGTIDTKFGNNGVVDIKIGDFAEFVTGITIDNEGNYLVSGHSELDSGESEYPQYESFLARITSDGLVDETFATNGIARFEAFTGEGCVNNAYANPIVAHDGQIFGTFYAFNFVSQASRAYLYNLDANGQLRETFTGSGIMPYYQFEEGDVEIRTMSLALQNESLIVGGFMFCNEGYSSDFLISRVFTDLEKPEAVEELDKDGFKVYPNPATSQLFVESEVNAQVSIIDLTGRVVKEAEIANNVTAININDINSGVYFVMIQNENNRVVEKLIVR